MPSLNEDIAELSKEKDDIMKQWIDGVYVGAVYVAAGIVAAYQCRDYLKDRFGKVNLDMKKVVGKEYILLAKLYMEINLDRE